MCWGLVRCLVLQTGSWGESNAPVRLCDRRLCPRAVSPEPLSARLWSNWRLRDAPLVLLLQRHPLKNAQVHSSVLNMCKHPDTFTCSEWLSFSNPWLALHHPRVQL